MDRLIATCAAASSIRTGSANWARIHTMARAVTGMSPLEFRNHLRLQEARRLMTAHAMDAASAGFAVGYDSPSHFSRDYARFFGATPASDARRLRAAS